jgi:hypothetical protein
VARRATARWRVVDFVLPAHNGYNPIIACACSVLMHSPSKVTAYVVREAAAERLQPVLMSLR